jgi:hypothetical protein
MTVPVEFAGIIVNMQRRQKMSEEGHIFPSGGKAGLVPHIPTEAGVGIRFEGEGEIAQHPLIFVGHSDPKAAGLLHQSGETGIAHIADGGRRLSRREMHHDLRNSVAGGIADTVDKAAEHGLPRFSRKPDPVNPVEGGMDGLHRNSRLLQKGKKTNSVVTKFTLKKVQNSTGITFSQVVCSVDRALTAEEQKNVLAMSEQVKVFAGNVEITAAE